MLAAGTTLAPVARAASVITVNETAQEINNDGDCSLQEAIYAANLDASIAPDPAHPGGIDFINTGCAAGSGADTIVLPGGTITISHPIDDIDNPLGPTGTPIIYTTITIEGNGTRIAHTGSTPVRAFAVASGLTNQPGTGDLTLRNVNVQGFFAKGGDGGQLGGGGGLGAGGGIYVREAALTVENSTFDANQAVGGNGGNAVSALVQGSATSTLGGGGGGGLGGGGGVGGYEATGGLEIGGAGGGGGGARGNGANGLAGGGGGGGTYGDGSSFASGGAAYPPPGGVDCGGAGGWYVDISSSTETDGLDGCDGGGGGGANLQTGPGAGGYAGGGGGGGTDLLTSDWSDGGHGGFGGGGGAGGRSGSGGSGGFGAGGGGGRSGFASGGTFGGHGGRDGGTFDFVTNGAGGGGAGLGGAIFSDAGTITVRNSTFTANSVSHGFAGAPAVGAPDNTLAADGADAGGAIFAVDGDLTVSNATISGNDSTGSDAGLTMYRSSRGGYHATLHLLNSIVAMNVQSVNECHLIGSVSTSGAGNLVTNSSNCPGIAVTTDPTLQALAIEAPGNTPTMAIDATSPAFDAGDDATCEAYDQRGVSRPRSLHCDIGAYEYIKPSADLAASTTNLGPAVAGQDLSFIVNLHDNGPTAAEDVSLTDTLPAGTTFVSVTGGGGFTCTGIGPVVCTKALMAEGATALFTVTVHLPASMAAGTSLTNAVSVASAKTPDPVPGNNGDSVTIASSTKADVSITKTGPSSPTAGTDVAYTISARNAGPSDAQTVAVSDTLPVGTTFQSLISPVGWTCTKPAVGGTGAINCTKATLPAGSTATFTVTVHLGPSAGAGSDLCNTAAISTATTEADATNNSSQTCGSIRTLADLSLTQTVSTTGKPGKGTATFTLRVTNLGPSDATNVSLAATSSLFTGPAPAINVPSGATCSVSVQTVTCSWTSIALGAHPQVTISVPWRSSVGSVTMTGTVTAGTPDPNAINNVATSVIGKK
jgi:uncharacterized repeat protein (TIGR01451 family)